MGKLTFKEVIKMFDELRKKYPIEDIMEMPVCGQNKCAYTCEELSKGGSE